MVKATARMVARGTAPVSELSLYLGGTMRCAAGFPTLP